MVVSYCVSTFLLSFNPVFHGQLFQFLQFAMFLSMHINLELPPQILNRIESWALKGPLQNLNAGEVLDQLGCIVENPAVT